MLWSKICARKTSKTRDADSIKDFFRKLSFFTCAVIMIMHVIIISNNFINQLLITFKFNYNNTEKLNGELRSENGCETS